MEARLKTGSYTYGDYRTWDDGGRWELIDGTLYAMSPAPTLAHQKLAFHIAKRLDDFLDGKPCEVFTSPVDVRFEESDKADTVVQPDVIVVCDPSKRRREGVVGAPDLVVEVLSPSTAGRDTIEKLRLYQREGVPEYWIVAPEEKVLYQHVLKDGQYDVHKVTEGGVASARLEGFQLDVDALFALLAELPG